MEQTILSPTGQKILRTAARSPRVTNGFYLTGGTALSWYYFHHRISEDLDFFSPGELPKNDITLWVTQTAKKLRATDLEFQTLNGQLVYYIHFDSEIIKVDFAQFPFDHIGEFHNDGMLRVASIRDIAANKLHALQTRARGRDFVDLYEIIHAGHVPITSLFADYRLKFDLYLAPEEWAKLFARVLDATDQPRFLGERSWNSVQSYFLSEAKRLAASVIT